MLTVLTLNHFAPLLGEPFRLYDAAGLEQTLRLVEAQPLGNAELDGRRPFSLIFEGPGGAPLAQQTYRFEQAAFDVLEMFIVPVGQGASGIQYQAVFN